MTNVNRMWINQPSTLQPYHRWHGENFLVVDDGPEHYQAFFLSGDVINMRVRREAMSPGWNEQR